MERLSLPGLTLAISGTAAALRCVTEYQPAGGSGDKIFPPTYADDKAPGRHAWEERRLPGETAPVPCVVLDSVQSQANRMEMALLDAWELGRIKLPVVVVDFTGNELEKDLRITSLEAPHRIADAILRDSLHEGIPFRKSHFGKQLDNVDTRNATALFEICPSALVFGMWDSTGPKGGLGAKFARAVVSEIIGINAQIGCKTSSRIDPLQVRAAVKVLKENDGGFKIAKDDKTKGAVSPSEINHGNIPPSLAEGGVTIAKALQTTVISLTALRRLRFPLTAGDRSNPKADAAARTTLAALGLCAATLTREQGCDLRSRCQLFPTQNFVWEMLDSPGESPKQFELTGEQAVELFNQAVEASKKLSVPWREEPLLLQPAASLVELVRRSQQLAAQVAEGE
jgi:CRISPR-associated protein Csb1